MILNEINNLFKKINICLVYVYFLTQSSDYRKQTSGLSEIEKYLQKQAEYEKTRKQKVAKTNKNKKKKENNADEARVKEASREKSPPKKKLLSEDRKRKKKRKKEVVGTETEDFVPWSVRPGRVVGERTYMYADDASGSEYVPSDDSDYQPSSDCESFNPLFSCRFTKLARDQRTWS